MEEEDPFNLNSVGVGSVDARTNIGSLEDGICTDGELKKGVNNSTVVHFLQEDGSLSVSFCFMN